MTSNKKILLFSLLALTTLCVQKDINGMQGLQRRWHKKRSRQSGLFSQKNMNHHQKPNKQAKQKERRDTIRDINEKRKKACREK